MVEELFNEHFLTHQNIFNVAETKKVIAAFYNGKKERAEKIWYLFMFQMWYKQWMCK